MNSSLGWLIFLLVNGGALYAASGLAGYLLGGQQRLSLRLVAVGLIYFAQITVTVLFVGAIVKTLNYMSVCITSLALTVLVSYLTRKHRLPTLKPFWQSCRLVLAERDGFLYFLVVLFVLQVVILLAKVAWLPPHVWDVFVYHLPPAVTWYQQGHIPSIIDTPVHRINGAPLGMTVLAFWYFIFFSNGFYHKIWCVSDIR